MWDIIAESLFLLLGAAISVLDFTVKTALAAVIVLIIAKFYFRGSWDLEISFADDSEEDPAVANAIKTLKVCRDTFRAYEKLHIEKAIGGDVGSRLQKAKENGFYADQCERALIELGYDFGEGDEDA